MTKILFSGIDKAFFDNLALSEKVKTGWLSIEELITTASEVDSHATKFVILYKSPEAFLAALGHEAISNVAQAKEQWLPQIELLTQFYLAHKDNALLLDSEHCETNFIEFRALLDSKFNIESQLSKTSDINELPFDDAPKLLKQSLQMALARALIDDYDTQSAYENLLGAADLLIASNVYTAEERASIKYDHCQGLVGKIKRQYSAYTEIVKDNESSLLTVQQLQEKLDSECEQNKILELQVKDNESIRKKLDENILSLLANSEQLEGEKDIALLQIEQLQEDVEAAYSLQKSIEKKLALSLEAYAKVLEELTPVQESNKRLAQEKLELRSLDEQTTVQLMLLQKQLESACRENKILENQLTDNQSVRKEIDLNILKLNSKNEQLNELEAENAIALLQIQQLQEELEFYFIEYKSLKNDSFINSIIPKGAIDKRCVKSLTLLRMLDA